MKPLILGIISLILLTGCGVRPPIQSDFFVPENEVELSEVPAVLVENTNNENPSVPVVTAPAPLPATFDAKVAFVSQAPHGNWSLPYQEACEEASLIMVSRHLRGQPLNNDSMDAEILKLVAWENEHLGVYTDTNVDEVARIAREYFDLNVRIVEDVSVERIKRELVAGNLIVAPFAGRELNNPYYTAPGPIYHMLVIRGYDRSSFITNDVGTRHGAAFKYKYETLINAIHDLPMNADGTVFRPYDDETLPESAKESLMKTGRKAILVISL